MAEVDEAMLLVIEIVVVVVGYDSRLAPQVVVRLEEGARDDEELYAVLAVVAVVRSCRVDSTKCTYKVCACSRSET